MPDWEKGDNNIHPATLISCMAVLSTTQAEDSGSEIWDDIDTLDYLRTHKYNTHLDPKAKDRVYHRAKQFRWLAHNLYKLQGGSVSMQLVPRPQERRALISKVHNDMGHYGVKRVIDILQKNYWWKTMNQDVVDMIRSCLPFATAKASFQPFGKD